MSQLSPEIYANLIAESFEAIRENNKLYQTIDQPRPVFLSLVYLVKNWQNIPLDILYNAIFFFGGVKKSWLFPEDMCHFIEYRHSFLTKLNISPLFMQLLKEKEEQGLVLYMTEDITDLDTDTDVPSDSELRFVSLVNRSSSRLTFNASDSGMESPLVLHKARGTSNLSNGFPMLAENRSSLASLHNRRSGSNVLINNAAIHPSFVKWSHQLSNIIDTQTGDHYLPLNLDLSFWSDIDDNRLKYVRNSAQVMDELKNGAFKFQPILEILSKSNPSVIPMVNWCGIQKYDRKLQRIGRLYDTIEKDDTQQTSNDEVECKAMEQPIPSQKRQSHSHHHNSNSSKRNSSSSNNKSKHGNKRRKSIQHNKKDMRINISMSPISQPPSPTPVSPVISPVSPTSSDTSIGYSFPLEYTDSRDGMTYIVYSDDEYY